MRWLAAVVAGAVCGIGQSPIDAIEDAGRPDARVYRCTPDAAALIWERGTVARAIVVDDAQRIVAVRQ